MSRKNRILSVLGISYVKYVPLLLFYRTRDLYVSTRAALA